jgi:hypothetical protein
MGCVKHEKVHSTYAGGADGGLSESCCHSSCGVCVRTATMHFCTGQMCSQGVWSPGEHAAPCCLPAGAPRAPLEPTLLAGSACACRAADWRANGGMVQWTWWSGTGRASSQEQSLQAREHCQAGHVQCQTWDRPLPSAAASALRPRALCSGGTPEAAGCCRALGGCPGGGSGLLAAVSARPERASADEAGDAVLPTAAGPAAARTALASTAAVVARRTPPTPPKPSGGLLPGRGVALGEGVASGEAAFDPDSTRSAAKDLAAASENSISFWSTDVSHVYSWHFCAVHGR